MNIKWQTAMLGLGLAALGYWATPAMADEWNKKTIFTFDQPVEVPGHVLTPGRYVFKLADLQSDRDVVQIFSEDKKGMDHLVTTAMAIPDYRMDTPEKPTVTFEERRSQSPEAIHSWFYPGDNYGWDFVYPKAERLQVAANTAPQPVQPTPAAPAPKPAVTTPPAKPVAAAPAPKPAPQAVTVAQNRPPAPQKEQPVSAPKSLPKTASNLPFVEALGGLLLALGAESCSDGRGLASEPGRCMRLVNWRVWLGRALLLGGASLLVWCGWVWHQAGVAQRRARESFDRRSSTHARAPRAAAPALHRGDVLGELSIPRLHLSVMVLEGDDEQILKVAAGHISGTALTPGTGNIAIAAHRDTFFRPLRHIRPDDLVTWRTRDGLVRFAVRDVEIVRPSDMQVLSPAPGRDLTLVTCYPFFYLGSAPKRFIVHARQVS